MTYFAGEKETLSDKIDEVHEIHADHVKEFIKELKEDLKKYWDDEGCFVLAGVNEKINKKAGDKLI